MSNISDYVSNNIIASINSNNDNHDINKDHKNSKIIMPYTDIFKLKLANFINIIKNPNILFSSILNFLNKYPPITIGTSYIIWSLILKKYFNYMPEHHKFYDTFYYTTFATISFKGFYKMMEGKENFYHGLSLPIVIGLLLALTFPVK